MSIQKKTNPADSEKMSEVCHMLPCSIDFSGRVQGAQHFFQPALMEEDSNKKEPQLVAGTLRGRGLLGHKTAVSSSNCKATLRVFKVGTGDTGVTVNDGPPIEKVVEWQHEHNAGNLNIAKSRLSTARAWCEVAQAMHEPLSPPEDF